MDIQISETDLFLATSKFTDPETAKQIVGSVKGIVAAEVKSANSNLSTNEDLYKVKEALKDDINKVKEVLKEDLYKVKEELKENISQVELRLSRSIYIVGLVQFLAIAGTVISVIAFMLQTR